MFEGQQRRVLLVEDEAIIALDEKMTLQRNGLTVDIVHTGEEAVAYIEGGAAPDLVLMDIDLGTGIDGTEAAVRILALEAVPILFLTSHAESEMVRKVKGITRYGYVLKNAGEFVLIEAIQTAFELFEAHRRLEKSERKYRTMVETAPMPFQSLDAEGCFLDVNGAWLDALGYSREEVIGRWFGEFLHPDLVPIFRERFEGFKARGRVEGAGFRLRRADGTYIDTIFNGTIARTDTGAFSHTICVFNEAPASSRSQQVSGEEHYLKRELYELVQNDPGIFEFLQAGSLDGIWYWDIEQPENEWMSPRFWELFGHDPAEKRHNPEEWQDIIDEEDLRVALENFHKHLADPNHPYDQVVRYDHKKGGSVWVRCRGLAIRDSRGKPIRMLGAHNDLTPLMEALQSKELLMKEFNHRVKNNLAAVSSLIHLKQRDLGETVDLSDLEHQIDTIRMVHESLQHSDKLSEVAIHSYVTRLLEGVFTPSKECPVEVRVSGKDVAVSTRQAVPIGLIVNELATNAQKHGFNGEATRSFSVEIAPEAENERLRVTVTNSGRPFPEEVDLDNPTSLGLRLVSALTAQLDGEISLRKHPHPVFSLEFPNELSLRYADSAAG